MDEEAAARNENPARRREDLPENPDMARKKIWEFSSQLKKMRRWYENPENRSFLHNGQLDRIATVVDSTNPNLGILINATHSLAMWEGVAGTIALINGDPAGWKTLRKSCLLDGWSIRIAFGLLDRGDYRSMGILPILFNQIALTLAQAIALGEDEFSSWCGPRILAQLESKKSVFNEWDSRPLGPFVMSLYCRWKGVDFPLDKYSSGGLGVYEGIFEHWQDAQGLANSISASCEFHKSESFDDPNGFPQFDDYPYVMFPVEILALRRVREDLGLMTPDVDNSLLDPRFMSVSLPIDPAWDALIDRIRFKAMMELPKIGDPW